MDRLAGFVKACDALLKPLGFRRRRHAWNRVVAEYTDVVDLQLSKSWTHVWVNLAVSHDEIYAACWGEGAGSFVAEYKGVVRAPLGLLANSRIPWDVDDVGAPDQVARQVVAVGVPFLDSMHSLEAVEGHLAAKNRLPPEAIYLAHVRLMLGRRSDACEALAECRRRIAWASEGGWLDQVDSLLESHGCV